MTNAAKVFVDQGLHPGVRGSSDLQGHFLRRQNVRRSVGRVRCLLVIKDLTLVVKDLSLVCKDLILMAKDPVVISRLKAPWCSAFCWPCSPPADNQGPHPSGQRPLPGGQGPSDDVKSPVFSAFCWPFSLPAGDQGPHPSGHRPLPGGQLVKDPVLISRRQGVRRSVGRVRRLLAAAARHERRHAVRPPHQPHRGQGGGHPEPRQLGRQPGPLRVQQQLVRRRVPTPAASAAALRGFVRRRNGQCHCHCQRVTATGSASVV